VLGGGYTVGVSDTETIAPQATDPAATDTSATVDTSDTSTQTNETPEATQQTEGTAEVKATDTVEEKLYAGKYKSVEDLENAYRNAESKLGQTTSEKAELARILNDAFAEPVGQTTAQEEPYDEPDPSARRWEQLETRQAITEFLLSHDDANPADLDKVLKTDPIVSQITTPQARLEYAYLRSQNMAQGKAIAEAEKKGAEATQAKIAEKQVAQVEAVKQTATQESGNELYEKATGNYTREERTAARMELICKNLINL
jgi:hypothetical protein